MTNNDNDNTIEDDDRLFLTEEFKQEIQNHIDKGYSEKEAVNKAFMERIKRCPKCHENKKTKLYQSKKGKDYPPRLICPSCGYDSGD